jgi:hypothetical protein
MGVVRVVVWVVVVVVVVVGVVVVDSWQDRIHTLEIAVVAAGCNSIGRQCTRCVLG